MCLYLCLCVSMSICPTYLFISVSKSMSYIINYNMYVCMLIIIFIFFCCYLSLPIYNAFILSYSNIIIFHILDSALLPGKDCSDFSVTNGEVTITHTAVWGVANVSCDHCYKLNSHRSGILRCMTGGIWNNPIPTCARTCLLYDQLKVLNRVIVTAITYSL